MSDPIFMVYRVGGGAPTITHSSYDAASDEANRLAMANIGKEFVVLKAVTKVKAQALTPDLIRESLI